MLQRFLPTNPGLGDLLTIVMNDLLHSPELRKFPGTPRNGTPFWEASYTTPINSWKFMGSLWEPYGKGVPFFGAPGNSLD